MAQVIVYNEQITCVNTEYNVHWWRKWVSDDGMSGGWGKKAEGDRVKEKCIVLALLGEGTM